jgi:hypothetical protein
MIKTIEDSIKKNLNHVMMVQKEKKKEEALDASQGIGQRQEKIFPLRPRALSLRQKASLTLLLMRNASTVTRRDISSGTLKSTWRSRRRRRREVKLPL